MLLIYVIYNRFLKSLLKMLDRPERIQIWGNIAPKCFMLFIFVGRKLNTYHTALCSMFHFKNICAFTIKSFKMSPHLSISDSLKTGIWESPDQIGCHFCILLKFSRVKPARAFKWATHEHRQKVMVSNTPDQFINWTLDTLKVHWPAWGVWSDSVTFCTTNCRNPIVCKI